MINMCTDTIVHNFTKTEIWMTEIDLQQLIGVRIWSNHFDFILSLQKTKHLMTFLQSYVHNLYGKDICCTTTTGMS